MIRLPKGYKAVKDRAVGISYYDSEGNIVLQNPHDTDSARRMLWAVVKNIELGLKESGKVEILETEVIISENGNVEVKKIKEDDVCKEG